MNRSSATAPHRARDVRGHWISLHRPPQRIVSLVPSLSELLCALGASRRVVGVTRYCTDPAAIMRTRARVGGTKNPDCAAILALRPDLVIANVEENRAEDVRSLEDAGLRVFVTFPRTVQETEAMIEHIGRLIGAEAKGSTLADRLRAARRDRRQRQTPRARVFCPIWRNPWMGFNRDTYAHDLLWQSGADNVCADRPERYPQITLTEVAALAPDIVLLPDEPYRFSAKHMRDLEPLHDTPAYRDKRMHLVDGQALSWYGPRTAAALRYFRRLVGR